MTDKKEDGFLKRAFVTRTSGYLNVFPKRELWKQIGIEFNGNFKIRHNPGNELEILRLSIPYKNLEIKLSESDTRPLKFEIEFKCEIDFEIIIGFEDSVEKILKLLGKKEVELGYEEFDNKYLIKSNDPEMTKKLMTLEIMNSLLQSNVYSLAYTTNFKKKTGNLISVISRTIDDKQTIENLIRLHMKIIDKMEELKIIS
jgi:hypothetical protein